MKEKSDRINHFLLQEQLPDIIKVAVTDKRSTNNFNSKFSSTGTGSSSGTPLTSSFPTHSVSRRIVTAVDHVTQLRLECCRCPHFQEYFPHILDLAVCRMTPNQNHPKGWAFANPVHALHMLASQSGAESSSKTQKQRLPPVFMYGEEQHRTIALQTEGIAEYWCSFDGNLPDTTAVPSKRQGSVMRGTASRYSPATLGFKTELAQQSSNKTEREGSSLRGNATDPSIAIERKLVLHSGCDLLPSAAAPQSANSNSDVVSSGSKIDEKRKVEKIVIEISSADKNARETGKDIEFTTAPDSNVSLAPNNETSSGEGSNKGDSADAQSTRSKMYEASTLTVSEKGRDEKTKREIMKKERYMSDSSSQQSLGKAKEVERSQSYALDAPGSNFVAAATLEGVNSNNSEEAKKMEVVKRDRIGSSQSKITLTPQLEGDYSAANVIKSIPIEEMKTTSKELTIDEKLNATESTNTTTESQSTKTNNDQTTVESGIAILKEDKLQLRRIEPDIKFESLTQNVDESNKSSSSIQRIETEKVVIKSKTEIPSDKTMQEIGKIPCTVHATTRTNLKDDVTKVKATIGISDVAEKVQQDGPAINGNDQMIVVDSSSKDANFDQNDAVKTNSLFSSIKSHLITTTRTATGAVVAASSTSTAVPTTKQKNHVYSQFLTSPIKSDPCMDHFRREEEKIRRTRRSLTSKRIRKKPDSSSAKEVSKKKRRVAEKSHVIPGWKISPMMESNKEKEDQYMDATYTAIETVERWIHQFRLCHESFWIERERQEALQEQQNTFSLKAKKLCCQWCAEEEERSMCRRAGSQMKSRRPFIEDELMQCLDCGFVGCSPTSLNSDTKQHMQQHLLRSGHKFAVSCGEKAQIFCSECGDYFYHEVFEQEKIRIACARKLPHMAWKENAILRSFDPFQFLKRPDGGILWRGLVATYPPTVPKEHFCATELTLRRRALFEGSSQENWILPKSSALHFAASQYLKTDEEKFKINAPVGIYNLGNTCFISSILQCLVFCKPLQQYFLRDSGHHYKSCEVYRHKEEVLTAAAAAVAAPTKKVSVKSKKPGNALIIKRKTSKIESEVCLACEMDRLFLSYYGSAIGNDIFLPIEECSQHLLVGHSDAIPSSSLNDVVVSIEKGDPLIISGLLTSAWKSGGMNHLSGYDQHDAHEFLDSFLDVLSKHIVKFRNRIHSAVTKVYEENAFVPETDSKKNDIIKNLFEGSLRSVLLCENCGVKRVQQEPFMNVSLSLSEEVERTQEEKGTPNCDINLETCLQHFVLPEMLGDLVYCNSCGKKTRTKKQHTFAKLPKILCLHLKRFDAAKNKKIENSVSFPSRGLNMGVLLSHWCEVTKLGSSKFGEEGSAPTTKPKILYDLFGTVNHIGNMQSGHYVANVKVDNTWYHCNDQHISYAQEKSVLKAEGAYVLFYIRRNCL